MFRKVQKNIIYLLFILLFLIISCSNIYATDYIVNDIVYDEIKQDSKYKKKFSVNANETIEQLFITGAEWDTLKLTDHFLSKYNHDKGIIPGLKVIRVGVSVNDKYLDENGDRYNIPNKYKVDLVLDNNEIRKYIMYFKYIDDYLDDIDILEVSKEDREKYNIDEIYRMY